MVLCNYYFILNIFPKSKKLRGKISYLLNMKMKIKQFKNYAINGEIMAKRP